MGVSPDIKSHSLVGVMHIKNFENLGLTEEQYKKPEYLADFLMNLWQNSGKERKSAVAVCESHEGCYHAHVALYSKGATTIKHASKIMGSAHIEPQYGGKAELTAYFKKEGIYEGKLETVLCTRGLDNIEDKKGKRSDLEDIEEMLEKGMKPCEIFEENFKFRLYDKLIVNAYFDKRLRDTPLIKDMWVEWHFGESGSGKSYHTTQLEVDYPNDVYVCNDYANSGGSGGGFDSYAINPAKVLVLDEFRGNIPFGTLLIILDKYSRRQIHARYKNVYALWEKVIICSIYPPEEVYKKMVSDEDRGTDNMKQLMRRINRVVYHEKVGDYYLTYKKDTKNYRNAEFMKEEAKLFFQWLEEENYKLFLYENDDERQYEEYLIEEEGKRLFLEQEDTNYCEWR